MSRIGFVGIGRMGRPMATRLAAAHELWLYDIRAEEAARLAGETRAKAGGSLRELAAWAEAVITMLPDSARVEQALWGPGDGLAEGLAAGTTVIEMSSGAPHRTVAIAQRLAAQGVGMIDAPVSGGVARAVTGELAIMVGGEPALVERWEPVLRLLGTTLRRTGGVGSAHAMKALNNLVSAGGFLIGIEALLVGAKFGLDPATMIDVLNASTGMNNSTKTKFAQFVLSRSFGSGFALDLMVKDLTNALELARETRAAAPFAALCREMWASAHALLGPGEDHTAMAKVAEKLAGFSLEPDAGSAGTGVA